MKVVANVLELVGTVSVVAGLWMLAPWSAFVAGGLLLIVFSIALSIEDKEKS